MATAPPAARAPDAYVAGTTYRPPVAPRPARVVPHGVQQARATKP